MEVDRFHELNALRIAASGTFGRLHVLSLIPDLLSLNPGLQVDLILSDFVRDMVEDGIDLAIRVGPVNDPDAIVRRVASTPLVCVGSPSLLRATRNAKNSCRAR